jgi:two-component system phosphate regulon sensor histidine kinase PhoR
MSDLRGIPKRSKTALVAVLLVFFQVLAFAVIGLGAINDDREATRQHLLKTNGEKGVTRLGQARSNALEEVGRQLEEAFNAQSWRDLRAGRRAGGDKWIVRDLFRVDADRTFLWLDPDTRYVLFRPLELLRADFARSQATWKQAMAAWPQARDNDLLDANEWLRLLTQYPLYVGKPGEPFPKAAAAVRYMLDALAAAALTTGAGRPTRATIRDAVLQALVVEGLNRDLAGHAFKRVDLELTVDMIRERVRETLLRIPPELQTDLAEEVRAFIEQRDFLADPVHREPLEGFLVSGFESLQDQPLGARVIQAGPKQIVAMQRTGLGAELRLVSLDRVALERLIRRQFEQVDLGELGMVFQLTGPGILQAEEPLGEQIGQVALSGAGISLPLQATIIRVREPEGEPGGRSELFYWAIIGLAAVGFVFGGILLVRLMTREIRLAQLKADFVSNLSHELKTPLTSISLFTEMLQEGKLTSPEDQQEGFDILAQESQRLQRVVKRMIEVARQESRGVAYEMATGDLNRPVLEATNRFRRIVTEPGLDLRIELAPEPLLMRLDAAALDDVITNLLSNAWKYKRGERATIRIRTARRGRRAELTVQDDGVGIPRSERKRVFEMFYRADQFLTQPVAGTGLGLALVRTVVRAHKGRVRITPGAGGVGTTFRLRFPLVRGAAALPPQPSIFPQNAGPGAETVGAETGRGGAPTDISGAKP